MGNLRLKGEDEYMEETITFELIRKIQREEQRTPKLTKLPENFYKYVCDYIERKEKLGKSELEIKNIKRLVENIFDRRERKILNFAIITARTGVMPENLTDEEKVFFNKAVELIKSRREEKLKRILSREEGAVSLIVFKEDVPAFVGEDEKIYGPFKKGDIAKLPEGNKRVLLERGVVEEFKIKK